ncbi:ABC transporter permease [Oleidesulfovibrio sp.]|uniref:ABC transporter permease n=1 Tax=Oleidesulfovibrio sp. TaxID=2909707 RepID=UPI003A8C57AB
MNKKQGNHTAKRQIVLPFSKSVEIAWRNLRVRFFRSLITTGSLVLAVAFLAFVLINLNIATGLAQHGDADMLRTLYRAGFDVDNASGTVQAGAKDRWIIILSLLVCAVGIVNAQLMSVTERFREIGIMKCLGALDSMILRLFLLEAAMQGMAGSVAGAVTGLLAGVTSGLMRFGTDAVVLMPWSDVLLSLAQATATGLALSLAGVLYPAIVAARMRPVVAMRADL